MKRTDQILSLCVIIIMLSSCGMKQDKAAQNEAQNEESVKQEYLKKGGEIVSLTQAELLKNVSGAMKTGGPAYAVDFCNLRAMALKDSLSGLNNCQIRRIAVKYRNPEDMPRTQAEKAQLNQYLDTHGKGESLKPDIHLFEDRVEYYHPILLSSGTCLLCHGHPGDQIAAETLEMIQARYPDDRATGFALNDFRGAWKITFMKQ